MYLYYIMVALRPASVANSLYNLVGVIELEFYLIIIAFSAYAYYIEIKCVICTSDLDWIQYRVTNALVHFFLLVEV